MDKLRSAFPITVSFSDGELPTSAKLNALASQAKNGLTILEYAIGDLWNQGGDGFLSSGGSSTTNALMIPNLARYLGVTSNTNPFVPYLASLSRYTHLFYTGDGFVGTAECYLSLPPSGATSFTWTGTSRDASPKATKGEVNASGNWYVDRTSGYCYFDGVLANGDTVAYAPNISRVSTQDGNKYGGWNIIPDPNTNSSWTFRGCKIAYTNNTDNSQGYIISFPPRGPLGSTDTNQTRYVDRGPHESYLHGTTANYSPTPNSGLYYMWQDPDQAAATTTAYANHYRYVLPPFILNSTSWDSSVTLPTGLIHIWDHYVTQTIITGLTVSSTSVPDRWAIVVSGAAIDTWVANNMSTCYPTTPNMLTERDIHTSDYYPANGLRVLCGAQSLSSLMSRLLQKFYDHDHCSSAENDLPTKMIRHSSLLDTIPSTYVPSTWSYDDHSQYLHRNGYGSRDIFNNGMFGDLLMLSTDAEDLYQNTTYDSTKILFGHPTTGPQIYYRQDFGSLAITKSIVMSVNDYVRINHSAAGTIEIEDPDFGVGSSMGGIIKANRHMAGTYNDSGSYGEVAGYGRVRSVVLSPQDFTFYTAAAALGAGPVNLTVGTTGNLAGFGTSNILTGILGKFSVNTTSSGNITYGICPIPIDALAYAIVNIQFAIYPYGASLQSNTYYCTVGSTIAGQETGSYGAATPPGSCWSMVSDVELVSVFGSAAAGAWTSCLEMWTPSTTLISTISNDIADAPSTAKRGSFLRLRVVGGIDAEGIYFSPVTVLYRVREF